MRGFLLALVLVAGTCSCVRLPAEAPDWPKDWPSVLPFRGRIIGGQPAEDGEYPSQVSLQVGGEHYCGGSVVNQQWIVTAAHCLEGIEGSAVEVLAGTSRLSAGGSRHQASRLLPHPLYNTSDNNKNDVALVQVSPPFELDGVKIRAVDLPEQGEATPDNVNATVIGWGLIYGPEDPTSSDVLMEVQLQTVSLARCREVYLALWGNGTVHDSQICAGVPEGGKGSCNTPSSQDEWRSVARQFKEVWNFDNCLGALDGKHVLIKQPAGSGSYYYNYKGNFSVVLFAVVNANYEFV